MRRERNALSFSIKGSDIKGQPKSPDSMPIQSESISGGIRQETCPGLKGAGQGKWKIVPTWTPSDIDLVRCSDAADILFQILSDIAVALDSFIFIFILISFLVLYAV